MAASLRRGQSRFYCAVLMARPETNSSPTSAGKTIAIDDAMPNPGSTVRTAIVSAGGPKCI